VNLLTLFKKSKTPSKEADPGHLLGDAT